MAKVSAGVSRTPAQAAPPARNKAVGAGEGDHYDGQTRTTAATFADDQIRIGTVETTYREGEIGGRASALDAEVSVFGDRVTLGATGPSIEGEAGLIRRQDFGQAKLGAGVGLGGVSG